MTDTLILIGKTFFYILVKALVGMLVIPLSVLLKETWKWFEEKEGVKKWLLAGFYFPAAGFLYVVGPWWGDF